mmetsp:Transcript_23487/g.39853  ORF Transcript_23487/g.39853 Transcript_23487/m.39853 type:complete len:122 (+) Transcript_23487:173-538(+)|eukprot:CAMPEP_0114429700 /NCGR_PEP_ID=MMETSP0103-20121206/9633_1 /TAXON_ID=37642 ORGANISM="Paraphysomonas imperforata, Strain PA2" /NCGR_SAMPLE_ID=MMETSP0103 /ASSEMBLY_ACC=CAM_ASM_000201 /LENGTH=121 /DNA_ID=CAMNT_0001599069 /DNA_START=163 /DNA_END=528 /DNA_ORIENTATION=+
MSSPSSTAVLSGYYDAMNAHNVSTALSFLHQDVLVTFPEQDRSWQGISVAEDKFSGMFERMPTFKGEFNVVSADEETASDGSAIDKITVSCKFQCVQSQSNSSRNMLYHIRNNLITQIHHL